jgi:hypothetical protein
VSLGHLKAAEGEAEGKMLREQSGGFQEGWKDDADGALKSVLCFADLWGESMALDLVFHLSYLWFISVQALVL